MDYLLLVLGGTEPTIDLELFNLLSKMIPGAQIEKLDIVGDSMDKNQVDQIVDQVNNGNYALIIFTWLQEQNPWDEIYYRLAKCSIPRLFVSIDENGKYSGRLTMV